MFSKCLQRYYISSKLLILHLSLYNFKKFLHKAVCIEDTASRLTIGWQEKMYPLFGKETNNIVGELNKLLVA